MQNEHRLSFCINLEVVIVEVEIQRSFFGRIHDTIDCFRDLLTFRNIKFCTHRFLSPIVGNVGIFETIEGVEELFVQTSEIAEIQESMGVCRIRRS